MLQNNIIQNNIIQDNIIQDNIKVKKKYIYKRSRLPYYGWLHPCILCGIITSNLEDVGQLYKINEIYKFIAYLCPRCKIKKHSGNKEINKKFKLVAESYINYYYPNTIC